MYGHIHHIEFNVSDLALSRSFWSWLLGELGYTLYQEWEHGFSYRQGESYLVFVQTESEFIDQPFHRKQTGLNHIAFHCPLDQLDDLHRKFKEHGITMLYEDRYPYAGGADAPAFYFEDPDRIKVEIAAYK